MGATTLALLLYLLAAAQDNPLRQAVRLDQQQRCSEAEQLYQHLLDQGSPSSALLNNLGNHYLICADPEKARVTFERLLKLNPRHVNANLQLARIATERHEGIRALEFLARVTDSTPSAGMLRAEAMYWAGQKVQALAELDRLADGITKSSESDPLLQYLYGMTCARIGAYERAVEAFNAVLIRRPGDYEVLFNLGRAAARANHYNRALQAFEVARKLQPGNVDVLTETAAVHIALKDYAQALYLLVQAGQLAPDRPEIALALARAAQAGGYYGDAALAFDRYLRLKPQDEAARRDRAFVYGLTDSKQSEGLKELRLYTGSHPQDPLGFYYLAQLTWRDDPKTALHALESSLRLDPKSPSAQIDFGWLLNREGRTAEAIPHFEKAVAANPTDARALEQLGAAYLSLDRAEESAKVLRKAAEISPADTGILINLGRALMESGHGEEGRQILDQVKKIRPTKPRGPWREPGMIESASLPAAERTRHEIDRLQREAHLHPDDPELQLRLASLLLADGNTADAEKEFRVLLSRNADAEIFRRGGNILLAEERYSLSREFLERAASSNAAARIELAAAVFYSEGQDKAMAMLDAFPASEKAGDFWLLKAKILDAAGRREESARTLEQGLSMGTSNPTIVLEAARLLIGQGRKEQALGLVSRGEGRDPNLLLMRAMLQAATNQDAAADKTLREIESQWPEWDRTYLIHGMLLAKADPRAAKQKIETALALGSQDPSVSCILAHLRSPSAPPAGNCSCFTGIEQMLLSSCTKF